MKASKFHLTLATEVIMMLFGTCVSLTAAERVSEVTVESTNPHCPKELASVATRSQEKVQKFPIFKEIKSVFGPSFISWAEVIQYASRQNALSTMDLATELQIPPERVNELKTGSALPTPPQALKVIELLTLA